MNIFDNLIQSQFNNFTGQAQPQVPSFAIPEAPSKVNYTPPVVNSTPQVSIKKSPTFFSDEQSAFDKMTADNISHDEAIQAIKSRRV